MKHKLFKIAALSLVISTNAMAMNKVIYGQDNRVSIEESDKGFLVDSVAAMVPSYIFARSESGEVLDSIFKSFPTLKSHRGYPTCSDMKFRSEPTISSCTGFLIGENLLMTAGHCMIKGGTQVADTVSDSCKKNKWVFNYKATSVNSDGKLVIEKNEVYGCKRVVAASYTGLLDYAVVELDRRAADKKPLKLNLKSTAVKEGTDIYVAGHPTGLPLKVSGDAKIVTNKPYRNDVTTDLDTFAGNSGSPVLNSKDEVVGILVAGEIDYVFDYDKMCYRVNKCEGQGKKCDRMSYPSKGAMGETVTKIAAANHDYVLKKVLGPLFINQNVLISEEEDEEEVVEEVEEILNAGF
ncbi:trypsin-like serine peptidase [Halobacteriovorax sp. YZS-1-1]|uniref:trypsin-like serine peptidase n=1 Tax=unclassified Halobacteriovorax TaxID=2639665 RepID=UPI003999C291